MIDAGLIGASGGILVVVGGGVKWILTAFQARIAESEASATAARAALEMRLSNEINDLRKQISGMEQQKMTFMRRIYQLEALIHKTPGLDLPEMNGWPP